MYCHRRDSERLAAGFYWKDFCHDPRACRPYGREAEVTAEEVPDETGSYWGR
jgi:hypothetical protein